LKASRDGRLTLRLSASSGDSGGGSFGILYGGSSREAIRLRPPH
jgi:hypothetical protein